MNLFHRTVAYAKGTIAYCVLYAGRKTMEIAVHPDSMVMVKAPLGTDFAEVQKRVIRRAGWIKRQLDYFRQFEPRTPERRYVGGETHLYLGKQYRLKINSGEQDSVKLTRGYFQIEIKGNVTPDKVRSLLEGWYANKAADRFKESLGLCWPNFEKLALTKPRLQMRRMQKRWGSLSKGGILTLNTDLIRAPKECVDYVITHELCHLQYHDHGPGFYKLLEKVMPDWEKRKRNLETALA